VLTPADGDLTRVRGLLVTWLPARVSGSVCHGEGEAAVSRLSEPDGGPNPRFAVFCGLDVGKSEHHACALDRAGRRLHDKPLPNDENASGRARSL
jgi:hypothetical protein